MTPPPETIPAWYRETPAGQADAEEHDRKIRDLHDRLAAEMAAVEAEGEKIRLANLERERQAVEKREKLRPAFEAADAAVRLAQTETRGGDRRTERRISELHQQLRATADPGLERLAAVLQERCDLIRGNHVDMPDGANAGAVSLELQNYGRECREALPILTTAAAVARVAKIVAAARATMAGAVASRYDLIFEKALAEGARKP